MAETGEDRRVEAEEEGSTDSEGGETVILSVRGLLTMIEERCTVPYAKAFKCFGFADCAKVGHGRLRLWRICL